MKNFLNNLAKGLEKFGKALNKAVIYWRDKMKDFLDQLKEKRKNITRTGIPFIEELYFERTSDEALEPTYATEGDSGMDVYSISNRFIIPGENAAIPTGLKFGIPRHPNHILGYRWEMQVRPRSGVSLRTFVRVSNSPGTIDNYYQDEVEIIVYNANHKSEVLELDDHTISLVEERVNWVYNLKGEAILLSDLGHYPENNIDNTVPAGTYFIGKHEKFAQLVLNEVVRPVRKIEARLDEVYDLSNHRGSKFGGTGI